jgi:hypothetical protein
MTLERNLEKCKYRSKLGDTVGKIHKSSLSFLLMLGISVYSSSFVSQQVLVSSEVLKHSFSEVPKTQFRDDLSQIFFFGDKYSS